MSTDPTRALTIEFLTWVAARPRSYRETMEAWRTSCPRLTIWEDAISERLVRIQSKGSGLGCSVSLTADGSRILAAEAKTGSRPDRAGQSSLLPAMPVDAERQRVFDLAH